MKCLLSKSLVLLVIAILAPSLSSHGATSYYELNERFLKPNCLGCHSGGAFWPDLTTYKGVVENLKAVEFRTLVKRNMPPGEELCPQTLDMLKEWIQNGAPEGKLVRFSDVNEEIFKPLCSSCHGKGIGNLVELDTYGSVKKNIQAVFAVSVGSDVMPPPPTAGDKSHKLTTDQKKLLSNWVRFGMLE